MKSNRSGSFIIFMSEFLTVIRGISWFILWTLLEMSLLKGLMRFLWRNFRSAVKAFFFTSRLRILQFELAPCKTLDSSSFYVLDNIVSLGPCPTHNCCFSRSMPRGLDMLCCKLVIILNLVCSVIGWKIGVESALLFHDSSLYFRKDPHCSRDWAHSKILESISLFLIVMI